MRTINKPLIIDDKLLCNHVHFTVGEGEHIALIGHNGVGKSTLLQQLRDEDDAVLLDEPTNYFDLEMQQVIEAMLQKFEGAMLFISHDPYFCEAVSTRQWKIENQTLMDLNLVGEEQGREELLNHLQQLYDILE